jgi:hypothetical protein
MMATRFTSLDLAGIDEGNFLKVANERLAELQGIAIVYAREHGDLAKGAKSKLTLEITFACDNPKDEVFSVAARTRITLPLPPSRVTMAVAAESDGGTPALFVRRSGSSTDHPAQGKLFTQDGRTINQGTGEAESQLKKTKA